MKHLLPSAPRKEGVSRIVCSKLKTLAVAFIPFSTGRDWTTCKTLKTVPVVQTSSHFCVTNDCTAPLDRKWKSNHREQATMHSASKSNTSGLLFCNKHLKAFECLPVCSERLCLEGVWCYLRKGQGKY